MWYTSSMNQINQTMNLNITQTYKAKNLQIGFVKTEIGDKWANDYYFIFNGQEPVGPYADEEDAYRGWFFSQEAPQWDKLMDSFLALNLTVA